MKHPSDGLAEQVDGPCVYTFTAHLPFPLGIPDDLAHAIRLDASYADPDDTARFGSQLAVTIRAFTLEVRGLPLWPLRLDLDRRMTRLRQLQR